MFRSLKKKNNKQFGRKGEDIAAEYLTRSGYSILSRNFRGNGCEIDIVAAEGKETVVFVEVKSRADNEFGSPADSVNRAKQKRIIRAARAFEAKYGLSDSYFRFDVIAITGAGGEEDELCHYKGAFTLPL